MPPSPTDFRYRGARALVLLHEQQMRQFLATWQQAKAVGVSLPPGDNKIYSSLERLLGHVLWSAGHYLQWICEQLELPVPEFKEPPPLASLESESVPYLEHILEQWRFPLRDISEQALETPQFATDWGPTMCVETMLEHAVMHPMRHRFQLLELMDSTRSGEPATDEAE